MNFSQNDFSRSNSREIRRVVISKVQDQARIDYSHIVYIYIQRTTLSPYHRSLSPTTILRVGFSRPSSSNSARVSARFNRARAGPPDFPRPIFHF